MNDNYLDRFLAEPDRLVREPERALITQTSRAWWAVLENEGKAPRRILVGPRTIAWRPSDLLAWIAQRAAVEDTPEC